MPTTEAEAWREFRDPIARVIGCVDQRTRLVERQFADGVRLLSSPTDGVPFGDNLVLQFAFHLKHVEKEAEQRMTTLKYTFTLYEAKSGDRVFGWHWHPVSRRSKVPYPHVHIPKGAPFCNSHVPTGRMSLEDVVLFGLDDLAVKPTVPTGRQIVIDIRDRHKANRGWH